MFYDGYPIYLATKEYQWRKHRKNRINKKWKKLYSYEINMMPHNEIMLMDNTIWMTKRTYEQLKRKVK